MKAVLEKVEYGWPAEDFALINAQTFTMPKEHGFGPFACIPSLKGSLLTLLIIGNYG
jgi:hypothetical protein